MYLLYTAASIQQIAFYNNYTQSAGLSSKFNISGFYVIIKDNDNKYYLVLKKYDSNDYINCKDGKSFTLKNPKIFDIKNGQLTLEDIVIYLEGKDFLVEARELSEEIFSLLHQKIKINVVYLSYKDKQYGVVDDINLLKNVYNIYDSQKHVLNKYRIDYRDEKEYYFNIVQNQFRKEYDSLVLSSGLIVLSGESRFLKNELLKSFATSLRLDTIYYDCLLISEKNKLLLDHDKINIITNFDKIDRPSQEQIINSITFNPKSKGKVVFDCTELSIPENYKSKFSTIIRIPDLTELLQYENFSKIFFNIFTHSACKYRSEFTSGKINIPLRYFELIKNNFFQDFLSEIKSLDELWRIIDELTVKSKSARFSLDGMDFWYEFLKINSVNKSKNIASSLVQSPNNSNDLVASQGVKESSENYKYVFKRKTNRKYEIVYNGVPIDLKSDSSDGLFYIHEIMKCGRNNPIKVSSLYSLTIPFRTNQLKDIPNDEILFENDDRDLYPLREEPIELIDKKTFDDVRRNKKELEVKQEFYEMQGDIQRAEEIQEAIHELDSYLKKNTRPVHGFNKGSLMKTDNIDQQNKKKIDEAVRRARKDILSAVKELGNNPLSKQYQEFHDFIINEICYNRGEYSYSYREKEKKEWILE